MGQQDQRQAGIGLQSRGTDPRGGLLQGGGTKHSLSGFVEVKATTGAGGAATHHSEARGLEFTQIPTAVPITQGVELALQGAATGIATGVVVAEDAGQGQGQLG
jgi:hypothetical protein